MARSCTFTRHAEPFSLLVPTPGQKRLEDVPIVTIPSQTVPGIRKESRIRQIAELPDEITIHAMARGVPNTRSLALVCHQRSQEMATIADREGSLRN